MSGAGVFGYRCEKDHVFNDTEALLAMKPKKFAVPKPVAKPPANQSELKFSMNSALATAVRERFKENTGKAIEGVCLALLDPGAFIVSGSDIERMKQLFNQPVDNAGKLIGMVFNLRSERDEAKKEAEAYKASPKIAAETNEVSGDFVQVSLRVGVDDFMAIKEKAKFNGRSTAAYINEVICNALAQGWF
jgi:predicted DNA binding CopG/RHH family protein